jgi:hypothetical protein
VAIGAQVRGIDSRGGCTAIAVRADVGDSGAGMGAGLSAMNYARRWGLALAAAGLLALGAGEALAQPVGLDPGRDCQTIRTCNFGRGGVYRGCLSSYSCRRCRFVPANCTVDGQRRVCQQMKCTWG